MLRLSSPFLFCKGEEKMKKTQMLLIGILVILLSFTAVGAVLQIKEVQSAERDMKKLQREIKELKNSMQELEEQKEDAEQKLQQIKEEEEKKEEEKKEQEEKAQEESETSLKKRKIAIDPGHQSPNVDMSDKEPLGPGSQEMKMKATGGTQGRFTGVPEYGLNLNISKQLRAELETRGYEVLLTREDNETAISNKERAVLAGEWGADIYVRIHGNGSDHSGVHGAMTMVPSKENPFVSHLHEKSYALGDAVIQAYCQSCGMKNNGVQLFDNMTGINWSSVPVIILEMGFMTNETDDRNMQDSEYQKLMVKGIADGIDNYFSAGN